MPQRTGGAAEEQGVEFRGPHLRSVIAEIHEDGENVERLVERSRSLPVRHRRAGSVNPAVQEFGALRQSERFHDFARANANDKIGMRRHRRSG